MKKRLAALIILSLMLTSLPSFAFASDGGTLNGWHQGHYYDGGGAMVRDAVVTDESGRPVCLNANGNIDRSPGWKNLSGGTYWVSEAGEVVTSPTKIKTTSQVKKKVKWKKVKKNGKKKWKYKYVNKSVTSSPLYMFGTDGKLITESGIFTYNGKEYYGLGGGILKTGWAAVKNKAMYFDPDMGAMAKGKTIGHLKIPASGRLGKAYALGVRQLDKMGWSLRKAYRFSYRLKYRDRGYRRRTSEQYAIRGFKKKNGNCYVMAATFYVMAKLLGYDVHQVAGRVDLPHSWTVIKQGGREWVYDPNFKNETGRNGWKLYYGKKGTWRYRGYHKMN